MIHKHQFNMQDVTGMILTFLVLALAVAVWVYRAKRQREKAGSGHTVPIKNKASGRTVHIPSRSFLEERPRDTSPSRFERAKEILSSPKAKRSPGHDWTRDARRDSTRRDGAPHRV